VAALVATVSVGAGPALADRAEVSDPPDDAFGPLDITTATFDNGDSRVVVTVAFDQVKRGNLAVSVEARGGPGLVLGTLYRPGQPTHTFALSGSFSGNTGNRVRCPGLASTWNKRKATVRLLLPARCLAHGEYGDLRFVVLSEDNNGGDSDFAPARGDTFRPTRWIARG
jgi:hypothetical protein